MASPLSGSLAKTIGKAFNGLFLDATLTRDVAVESPDPADPLPPTTAVFACKAIVESYSDFLKSAGVIAQGDRKVLILAASLDTRPVALDRVTIQGVTFTLSEVETDPATAVWLCKGSL